MNRITTIIRAIDATNIAVGSAVMWLTVAMALVQFAIVVLRHVFSVGFISLQESIWYMNGTIFMLGAGYALLQDAHVRVDVFYRDAPARYRATVDLVGALVFLLPLCIATFLLSRTYVLSSWRVLEGSIEVSGLPFIYLLKTVIWIFAVLLGLQGIALAGRAIIALRSGADHYSAAGVERIPRR